MFKYSLISLPIALVSEFIGDNYVIGAFLSIINLVIFFFMLLAFGKLIKSEYIKILYMRCIRIILGSMLIGIVLSEIFNIPTTNNWIASIFIIIIFSTISTTIFKSAREMQKTNEISGCFLYIIAFASSVIVALSVVFFILDIF